jgi:hypothetical protein
MGFLSDFEHKVEHLGETFEKYEQIMVIFLRWKKVFRKNKQNLWSTSKVVGFQFFSFMVLHSQNEKNLLAIKFECFFGVSVFERRP